MGKYISVTSPDGSFDAYMASPKTSPSPAIVVIQEIFGVNADLRETCDELSMQGYVTVSPDLFWRIEPSVDMTDQSDAEWKKGLALYSAFDLDAGVTDIGTTIANTRSLPECDGKAGLMGYCLGGLMTYLTTARKEVDASVIYYGGNTEKHLEEANNITTPLLIHLGEEDEYIPREAQQAIMDAFSGNSHVQVFIYPGCKHAFARHHGTNYNKAAAILANNRTADFFKRHLQ